MAEAVLKKRIVEAIEGRHFDRRNTGRIPFSEFADTYITRCISILKSRKTERIRVLYWKRIFGNRPIGQITTAELQDWQAQRRATTNKPATINRMLSRLRHMFNRAIEWDLLDESPMNRVTFLHENNARLRYLSVEECGKLLAGCGVEHMRGIITVALHTGMRLGEILDLKHPDIDYATGVLAVRSSKNGESRHIPMDSTVTALFKRIPKQSNSDYVFPSRSGERWSCTQKAFRHARKRAGLVIYTFMICGTPSRVSG
jgi:integrase